MSEARVIFSSDDENITIDCSKEDKMKDICQKYSTRINKNINNHIFLYGTKEINLELRFKDIANSLDINNNQIKILVKAKFKENNRKIDILV